MYYLVNVDHKSMAMHLTRNVKGFKKCHISNVVVETDDDMLWNGVKRMGMLGISMRKMKTLTMKMEEATLTGKGR